MNPTHGIQPIGAIIGILVDLIIEQVAVIIPCVLNIIYVNQVVRQYLAQRGLSPTDHVFLYRNQFLCKELAGALSIL